MFFILLCFCSLHCSGAVDRLSESITTKRSEISIRLHALYDTAFSKEHYKIYKTLNITGYFQTLFRKVENAFPELSALVNIQVMNASEVAGTGIVVNSSKKGYIDGPQTLANLQEYAKNKTARKLDVYWLFIMSKLDGSNHSERFMDDGVISTNGTLCTEYPSAIVQRHFFFTGIFFWRQAEALLYIFGAQPMGFFTHISKENLDAVRHKIADCKKICGEKGKGPTTDMQEPVNLTVHVLHNLTNGQYLNVSTNGKIPTEDVMKKHFEELFKRDTNVTVIQKGPHKKEPRVDANTTLQNLKNYDGGQAGKNTSIFYLFVSHRLTEVEGVTAHTRDRGTVASTNGTLCTSEPNAAIVRHFYTKPDYFWRAASALAYMCGAEPIDYFSSLTTEDFTKVVKKLLTCHKPGAEESIEPTSTGTEEGNTPTVPGIISC
ncbi:uncharacterized protein LOC142768915 isoform X2 [Rhipicephalus microplus]|uniref:uncharacterized protein LOC142768915 isoform X2 n=1 Tax=Rhipicephalus microplus TaxID=6941 RepID=UPI003F6D82D6